MASRLESLPPEILTAILEYVLVPRGQPPFSTGIYPVDGNPVLCPPWIDEEGLERFGLSLATIAAQILFGQNLWRLDAPEDGKEAIVKSFWQHYGRYCRNINMVFWPYLFLSP